MMASKEYARQRRATDDNMTLLRKIKAQDKSFRDLKKQEKMDLKHFIMYKLVLMVFVNLVGIILIRELIEDLLIRYLAYLVNGVVLFIGSLVLRHSAGKDTINEPRDLSRALIKIALLATLPFIVGIITSIILEGNTVVVMIDGEEYLHLDTLYAYIIVYVFAYMLILFATFAATTD